MRLGDVGAGGVVEARAAALGVSRVVEDDDDDAGTLGLALELARRAFASSRAEPGGRAGGERSGGGGERVSQGGPGPPSWGCGLRGIVKAGYRRAVRKRIGQGLVIAVPLSVAALDGVALALGYLGAVGPPVKAGGLVVVGGVTVWLVRREKKKDFTPTVAEVLLVVFAAAAVGFAWAWVNERPAKPASFDYVVTPKGTSPLTAESVNPGPGSDVTPAHEFGEHVAVTCVTDGSDKHRWYRLVDHNFMSEENVQAAPLSKGRPDDC
jgi:hypothetical protein